MPFTFLRNGWYTENYAQTVAQALATGSFAGSAGETGEGHEGKAYELAGDEPWSYADLAAASGKPVTYQDLPGEQHRRLLVDAGLPEPIAAMLADADRGIRDGELSSTSGDLRELIGRPTTPLADAVAALVKG